MILFTIDKPYEKDIFYKKVLNQFIITFQNLSYDCELVPIGNVADFSQNSLDFVFCLNSGRKQKLQSSVPWVSWFHDVHMNTIGENFSHFYKNDIAYFIGEPSLFGVDPEKLPIRSLILLPSLTSCDTNFNDHSSIIKTLDILLIGYLPPIYQEDEHTPDDVMDAEIVSKRYQEESKITLLHESGMIFDRHPYLRNLLIKVVLDNYRALSGNLDTNKILSELCSCIDKYFGGSKIRESYGSKRLYLDYYATHLPRRLDRIKLAELGVESGCSFEIIGKGWENEHRFINHYLGFINPKFIHSELSKSRFILCNNTHGLSFNHRIIDAIMNDCIVFNHTTPHAGKLGTLENCLIPEEDFIQYDEANLLGKIQGLLQDESKMQSITKSAKSKILNSHNTTNRAKQILKDLNLSCN